MSCSNSSWSEDDRSTFDSDYVPTAAEMSEANFDLNLSGDEEASGDLFSEGEDELLRNLANEEETQPGPSNRVTGCSRETGQTRNKQKPRSRHPTGSLYPDPALDLLEPEEYLKLNENANTRKNVDSAVANYDRVMMAHEEKSREKYIGLDVATPDELPRLLLKFLQIARQRNKKVYAAGALNTMFNNIVAFLIKRKNDPVNPKIDPRFSAAREMLKQKGEQSQAAGRGIGCDAKRSLQPKHLISALQKQTIGRDSPKAFSTSVYLAAVLGWGCRTGAECHMITNEDLILGQRRRDGIPEYIELSERITKTRRGNPGDERELEPKLFPDDDYPETCYVRTVLEFLRRKSPQQKNPLAPYFLNSYPAAVMNPSQYPYWYVGNGDEQSGIMGIHTLESLLNNALELAGVNCKTEKYSAISLRKAMLQSSSDCDVPDLHISRIAGHKSLASKKKYINSAGVAHRTTSRVVHRQMFHMKNAGYSKEMRNVINEEKSKVFNEDRRSSSSDGRPRTRSRSYNSGSRKRSKERCPSSIRRRKSNQRSSGSRDHVRRTSSSDGRPRTRSRSYSSGRRNRSKERCSSSSRRRKSNQRSSRSRDHVRRTSSSDGRPRTRSRSYSIGRGKRSRERCSSSTKRRKSNQRTSRSRVGGQKRMFQARRSDESYDRRNNSRSRSKGRRRERIHHSSRNHEQKRSPSKKRVASYDRNYRYDSRSRERRRERIRSRSVDHKKKRCASRERNESFDRSCRETSRSSSRKRRRERHRSISKDHKKKSNAGKKDVRYRYYRSSSRGRQIERSHSRERQHKQKRSTSSERREERSRSRSSHHKQRSFSNGIRENSFERKEIQPRRSRHRSSKSIDKENTHKNILDGKALEDRPTLSETEFHHLTRFSSNTVSQDAKMFECIDQVANTTENDIQEALEVTEWNVEMAVKELKVTQLMKCPKVDWKLGLQQNRKVCSIALNSVNWNLELACKRVRGEKILESTSLKNHENITQPNNHEDLTSKGDEIKKNKSSNDSEQIKDLDSQGVLPLQIIHINNGATNDLEKPQKEHGENAGKENLSKVAQVNPGQIMLHKLNGFPHWPVKITSKNDESVQILYYGTKEVGTVKSMKTLFEYTKDNKKKFQLHLKKSRKLKLAIKEADAESLL